MDIEKPEKQKKITPFSFIGSIFAAWFGVQTRANRESMASFTTLSLAGLFLQFYLSCLLLVL